MRRVQREVVKTESASALPDVAAQFHVGNIGAAAAAPVGRQQPRRALRARAAALRQRARQRLATSAYETSAALCMLTRSCNVSPYNQVQLQVLTHALRAAASQAPLKAARGKGSGALVL